MSFGNELVLPPTFFLSEPDPVLNGDLEWVGASAGPDPDAVDWGSVEFGDADTVDFFLAPRLFDANRDVELVAELVLPAAESVGSADATAVPLAMAAPTPKAKASGPTRPMNLALRSPDPRVWRTVPKSRSDTLFSPPNPEETQPRSSGPLFFRDGPTVVSDIGPRRHIHGM